ncbi:MAG: hypothetical protein GXP24_04245 [Planctomycetes bacterium]|nr:hypothetical protein [Planctomycetota bacterium]
MDKKSATKSKARQRTTKEKSPWSPRNAALHHHAVTGVDVSLWQELKSIGRVVREV